MRILLLLVAALLVAPITAMNLVAAVNARTDVESDPEGLSLFHSALSAVNMLEGVLGNSSAGALTVFAPNNKAIKESQQFSLYMKGGKDQRWHEHLKAALQQHIVPHQKLQDSDIFDKAVTKLESMHDPIVIDQFEQRVQLANVVEANVEASNGVLHVIDKVIKTKFMDEDFAMLELQSEYGPDHLEREALTDVVDFIGARGKLKEVRDEGQTFIGCRIRAFNRLEEYLPQTINEAEISNVKFGEFFNESFKQETTANLIEYSLIPQNYYFDDIPRHFLDLIKPVNQCGHMWVTKRDGVLCFNNGCVVETPNPREFLAGNGVGYVIDKCQVCPGVSMLTKTAADFTRYDLKDAAQMLYSSEWNMRDLRLSVGNGTKLTFFASIGSGWHFFNQVDKTRLTTDKWKRHQWDLLSHMLVQGYLTKDDLRTRYDQYGPYNLTSLAGQEILVDYDDKNKKLLVDEGDLIYPDIEGVDGLVHFTTTVPLPISATHTIYDIAAENPNFTTHILYIDTVQLDSDMKRLLPITGMFAPNDDWANKATAMKDIADKVLKNHLFEELMWCDTLRDMANQSKPIVSLNKKTWRITMDEFDMPCFETLEEYAENVTTPEKACITECDILARNGIVHNLDKILLFEEAETRPPSAFGDFPLISPGAPSPPTVFSRPIPSSNGRPSAPTLQPGNEKQSGATTQSMAAATALLSLLINALLL